MLDVLSAEPAFANTASGYAPRRRSARRQFEQRGLRLGHGVVRDLMFVRTANAENDPMSAY